MRKPVIGFTDSEFAKFSIKLTKPFTDYIFTPACFWMILEESISGLTDIWNHFICNRPISDQILLY